MQRRGCRVLVLGMCGVQGLRVSGSEVLLMI